MELITGIIGLIMLISFFIMGSNLGKIVGFMKNHRKCHPVSKCGGCKKVFEDRPTNCPHCGIKIVY